MRSTFPSCDESAGGDEVRHEDALLHREDPISLDEAHRLARPVDGWLTPSEGARLYELARCLARRGPIVEIGSFEGRSTIYLAQGVRDGVSSTGVHAVDPHDSRSVREPERPEKSSTYVAFMRNIRSADVEPWGEPRVKDALLG